MQPSTRSTEEDLGLIYMFCVWACAIYLVYRCLCWCCCNGREQPLFDEESQRQNYQSTTYRPPPQPSPQPQRQLPRPSGQQQQWDVPSYYTPPPQHYQTVQPSRQQPPQLPPGNRTTPLLKPSSNAPILWAPPSRVLPPPPKRRERQQSAEGVQPQHLPRIQTPPIRRQKSKKPRQQPAPQDHHRPPTPSTSRTVAEVLRTGLVIPPQTSTSPRPLISGKPSQAKQTKRSSGANTVDQQNEYYTNLRAQASNAGTSMGDCFRLAKQAFRQGDRARGLELTREGNKQQAEMTRLNAEASEWIFAQNNQHSSPGELDLHGLHVSEATARVQRALVDARRRGDTKMRIITGKGLHSPKQVALIKPAIERVLAEQGVTFKQDACNAGVLIVSLNTNPGAVI